MRDNEILQLVRSALPNRPDNAHKGTMGTMLNISGSYSMAGACVLSSMAALRTGVGLLKIILPQSIYPIVASSVYEAVFMPVTDGASGTVTVESLDTVLGETKTASSALIGCGLKNTSDTREFCYEFVKECECPLVIDADGINAISQNIDILKDRRSYTVLTPHVKEMSRLVKKDVDYVCKNLQDTAVAFAKEYGVTIVLKGSDIVVTDGNTTYVLPACNSGMAKGGSGDVLSGVAASLLAQGTGALQSALCGVYLHQTAGDIAAQKYTKPAMLPRDVVSCLSDAFRKITE